jgi:hypothetical protein
MKLTDLREFDSRLSELLPPAPGAAPAPTMGQQPAPQSQPAGLAGGQMNPAQAAQAAKDRMDQKKQVQDQIKQTEQQLNDLRKQLAELG